MLNRFIWVSKLIAEWIRIYGRDIAKHMIHSGFVVIPLTGDSIADSANLACRTAFSEWEKEGSHRGH